MTWRITHGHSRGGKTTREFNSWLGMRQRCTDPNHHKWPRYGGRGIKVCARWLSSFEAFLADMGPRPSDRTLDRYPDRDGDYEPGNCRWATAKEQAANRARPSFDTNSQKTHCPSGHAYAGNNLRITKNGGRKCRECERLRAEVARGKHKVPKDAPLVLWKEAA